MQIKEYYFQQGSEDVLHLLINEIFEEAILHVPGQPVKLDAVFARHIIEDETVSIMHEDEVSMNIAEWQTLCGKGVNT